MSAQAGQVALCRPQLPQSQSEAKQNETFNTRLIMFQMRDLVFALKK